MKPNVIESQSTTISDDIINGEICFRLENVPLGVFLGLRGKIRNLLGDGPMLLDHMTISEKALVVKNQIEKHPELGTQAIPAPIPSDPMAPDASRPMQKLRGQPPRERTLYVTRRMFNLLKPLVGLQQDEIIETVKKGFPKKNYSNDEILKVYNKIHGIR